MEDKIIIYTDGSSSGNPGPGGWGVVYRDADQVFELGGSAKRTTNNRMEMTAAIEALKAIQKGGYSTNVADQNKTADVKTINLYTDSQYLINGITKWIFGWLKNNWRTKTGEVLNKDLWQELLELTKNKKINWIGVSGHAGVALNNRVDEIAVGFSKYVTNSQSKPDLYTGKASGYAFEVKEPTESEMNAPKNKSHKQKAYSYLSMIDGVIKKHTNWEDCKSRAQGKPNAKYRKSISPENELEIIKEWTQKKEK